MSISPTVVSKITRPFVGRAMKQWKQEGRRERKRVAVTASHDVIRDIRKPPHIEGCQSFEHKKKRELIVTVV